MPVLGQYLAIQLLQIPVKFRFQLHMAGLPLGRELVDQGMAPGVQAVVPQKTEQVGFRAVGGRFAESFHRIAEKDLAGKTVKAVAQLCDGCGSQRVVVKQQIRALEPHVVKLGEILGKHRVFAGRGHFPAEPQMRVGRRHGSHLVTVFSIVTDFL